MVRIRAAVAAALMAALTACSGGGEPSAAPTSSLPAPGTPTTGTAVSSPPPETSTPTTAPGSPPADTPAEFDAAPAARTVRELAGLGPREATSSAFRQASDLVATRLTELGYRVTRQRFRVPAGVSWGVPVGAGTTSNLVARLPRAAGEEAYVVGAHLDTVPQAPGAEDNASGVAVLLQLADLAARHDTRHPVTFVVFGAEEPRGPADDEHHFGSQEMVRRLERSGAGLPPAMVSLDRVGTRGPLPVCTGGLSPLRVRRQLLAAADRVGVPAQACENRTSDHWPFEKAGGTVARLGGLPYAAYHSPRDRPRVVSRQQLGRAGRTLWEWLRAD